MRRRSWFRVSLARKVSLLFGTAVLLIIAVTLIFPRFQMNALNEQAMLLQAQRIASAAYQAVDLHEPDWQAVQVQLDRQWPLLVRELGLPPQRPRLVPDGPLAGHGFQRDAIHRLRRNPGQRYYWRIQDEASGPLQGRIFRFAMAVRGATADPHPRVLRGIIDIRLPTSQAGGVWNSVVTILAGASGAVLAILVFYMVTQRLVLSPVRTLRRVAERVTTGDIGVRSSIRSGDEFEELSDAFNDMLTHLKAAQEEQQKINRSLDVRLEQLAQTNVALFESDRLKSKFLANVTHELRTPLVSIIGFAELLRDAWENPKVDRARLARYSENIRTSGCSLLDIINDLLDLAKIEAGKLELHVSEFSMTELCRDLIDFTRPLADKRNQNLTLELAEDLGRCRSDSGKVTQILYNLVSNAIKFTPTGGTISLRAKGHGKDRIRLSIHDTGPGIADDQRRVIFEKFRQLDASTTREHEGTGLGLAITKELVHLLGGTIQLESREGQGCTFTVELPTTLNSDVEQTRTRAM